MTNQKCHPRWEIYYGPSDEPIGLLHRRWDAAELVTTIIFASPEPHHVIIGSSWRGGAGSAHTTRKTAPIRS